MSFFDSKLFKNMEETGELPELPISLDNDSIIKLCLGLLSVGLVIVLTTFIFNRLKS